ncbi:MAG: hypothetical protein LBT83_11535 [Tannerella sp.]|nr:hypothetical protein [Tannerella sp.]
MQKRKRGKCPHNRPLLVTPYGGNPSNIVIANAVKQSPKQPTDVAPRRNE